MARTTAVIQQAIIASLVTSAAAVGVVIVPAVWSTYDYRQLLTFITASAIAILEQLWDAYTAVIEGVVSIAPPQTALWIQNLVLNIFQYSSTVPQIIQFDTVNIAPYYPVVTPALRIVTQCAVVPGVFGTTTVKVAKAGPVPLAALELSALQSTLNIVTVPGINLNAISNNPDQIYISGIVTYSGQYSALIPVSNGAVVQALQSYVAAIPTTGIVSINSPVGLLKLTDLIAAVRAVPGVVDFELININARPDAIAFVPGAYNLVSGADWITNQWNSGISGAGYMISESTTGYTLNDSLTYNAV